MRTLSIIQNALRENAGKAVAWVVEIYLPQTDLVRLSNREVTIGVYEYEAKLIRFGDGTKVIPAGVDLTDAMGSSSGFDFTVRSLPEDAVRFSDLVESRVCDGSEVRFGCIFMQPGRALEESDIIWLHTYVIDSYTVTSETVNVRCVDYAGVYGNNKILIEVRDADFPNAPHESYGQIIPKIFGTVTDCPLLPVSTGGKTYLDGHVMVDDRVITVDDVSGFSDPPSEGALIEIDDEMIRYYEIDRALNTFGTIGKLCDRAAGGTAAAEHADGETVYEVADHYDYLVADHACADVSNVRVGEDTLVDEDDYELDTVQASGRDVQLLRMLKRPKARRWQAGSQKLVIEGVKEEVLTGAGPDYEWEFRTDDGNEDAMNCITSDEVTQYTKLTKNRQVVGYSLQGVLGETGFAKYGRCKKMRLGIEYQCSGLWKGNTWPYWFMQLSENGDAQTSGGLKKPDPVDNNLVVDEHEHQEQSDWTIDSTKPLFDVEPDVDPIRFNTDDSNGNQENGTFYENFSFKDINVQDGSHVIQKLRWRILVDGYITSMVAKITLPNGKIYSKVWSTFAIPEEKVFEIATADVGEITFEQLRNNEISFRVDGKYTTGYWVGLDSILDVEHKYYIKGQDTDLGQKKEKAKTSKENVGGETSTSRITMYADLTYFAKYWGEALHDVEGWGIFGARPMIQIGMYNAQMDDNTEIYIYRLWLEVDYQPFITEISDTLIADVSGAMNALVLMEHPVDVLIHLLTDVAGVSPGYINQESFDAVKAVVGNYCPKVARHINSQTTARELIQQLLTDTNMRLIFEGTQLYLKLRDWEYDQDDSVGEITADYFAEKSLEKVRSGTDQLFNQLALYFNRSPINGNFRRVREFNDLASQKLPWGVRRETYDGYWHGDNNATAKWIGESLLAYGAWKYSVIKMTLPLNWIHLELGDIVELTHERSGLEHNLGEVVMLRVAGADRIQAGVAIWDTIKLGSASGARIEADRGGRWMRFYVDGRLTAILDIDGNFTVRGRAKVGMGGFIPWSGDEYDFLYRGIISQANENPPGHHVSLITWLGDGYKCPLILWGGLLDRDHYPYASYPEWGAVLYGSQVKFNQPIDIEISDYVELAPDGSVIYLSPNGKDVAAYYEYIPFGETGYPGVWRFKGKLRSNGIK